MEAPKVRTAAVDAKSGVKYVVVAYRPVTKQEVTLAVRMYLADLRKKRKRLPKKGTEVTIVTVIGC